MADSKHAVRQHILSEYRLGHSAKQSFRNQCQIFGKDAVSYATCKRLFQKFREGDFSLEDLPRTGAPLIVDREEILDYVAKTPTAGVRGISSATGSSKSTVQRVLYEAGMKKKKATTTPHDLSPKQLKERVDVCNLLLSRERTTAWISRIVTCDEKWISYDNPGSTLQWVDYFAKPTPVPKRDIHAKKQMLSIWWDSQGVIYRELLPYGTTINAKLYSSQLHRMAAQMKLLRPGATNILLIQDNARPHTAKYTQTTLKKLNIETLPHPPYSPDISPSDYYLFRSMQHDLAGKKFNNQKELETDLDNYFQSKPASFYKDGIDELPDRWRRIIASNGVYIVC